MNESITLLLQRVEKGESAAATDLLPLVYEELRKLAAARMAALPPGQTIQPTALVHDAYLRLVGSEDPGWEGRRHFFGAAANAMRQILVDAARRKAAAKHGGDRARADLELNELPASRLVAPVEDMLALDEALNHLQTTYPEKAEIVLLRCVLGLSREDTAATLGISTRTLDRHWRFIAAHMHASMHPTSDQQDHADGSTS